MDIFSEIKCDMYSLGIFDKVKILSTRALEIFVSILLLHCKRRQPVTGCFACLMTTVYVQN